MALADTARLIASLELQDKLSGPAKRAEGSLGRLDKSMNKLGSQAGKGVGNLVKNLTRVGVVAAGAVVGGLVFATKAAVDFEDAFAGIRKTVDEAELEASGLSFAKLSDAIRKMSTEIPIAATELAGIGEAAGALGIKGKDIEAFTRTVAELSVTTDLTSEAASTALGQLGTTLNLTGGDFESFGDTLVALGNAGASTESQIVEISSRFAAAGKAAGLSTEEILALSSATASMGIEAEAGGSALSRVFNSVATNIGTGSAKAAAFADSLGLSAAQFRRSWEKDAVGTMEDFLEHLGTLDQFEAASLLKKIGITNTRDVATVRLMGQNVEFVNEQLEIARTASGALGEEAAKKFATTASQIQLLKNNATNLGITIGTAVLPRFARLLERLNAFARSRQVQNTAKEIGDGLAAMFTNRKIEKGIDFIQTALQKIRRFAKGADGEDGGFSNIASNIGTISQAVAGLPWQAIGDAARLLGTGSKALLDAFLGLPPWVQTAVLTGWGLNKLTGGALGGIAASVGGALGKIFAQKLGLMTVQAGVVNVTGAAGVTPTPTAGGGGGGAGRVVAGVVGTVGIAATIEGGFSTLTKGLNGDAQDREDALLTLAQGFPGLIAQAVADAFGFNQDPEKPADDKPQPVTDQQSTKTLGEVDHGIAVVNTKLAEAEKANVTNRAAVIAALNTQKNELQKERAEIVRNKTAVLATGRETASKIKTGFTDNGGKIARMHADTSGHLANVRAEEAAANQKLEIIKNKKSSVNVTVETNTSIQLSASQMALRLQQVIQSQNYQIDEVLG